MGDMWRALRRPTLRMRLTLLSTSLLAACALSLALFIDLGTTLTVPGAPPDTVVLVGRDAIGHPVHLKIDTKPANRPGAGNSTLRAVGPSGAEVLFHLRLASLLGLGVVLVVGSLASYWLCGRALGPVQAVSRAARSITSKTLDTRLGLSGPNDEVKDLADAFDKMLDRLQRSFLREERFISDASHELRTPLAIMRTNMEVVRADRKAGLEDYRDLMFVLERSLTRLEQLVEGLLALAREEEAQSPSMIDVRCLLRSLCDDLQSIADEHDVRMSCGTLEDVVVKADEPLLRRALSNLVENSIRYNKPGGHVLLECSAQGVEAEVVVIDTGIGIPEEEAPFVFQPFWRGSRVERLRGSGLGLALSMDVVRRHGGDIRFESRPAGGSTFYVRMPAWQTERRGTRNLRTI